MPHREPNTYTYFDWAILTVVAMWSSLSAFLQRDLTKYPLSKKLYFAMQDFIISSGTTYLIAIGLMAYGISQGVSIAIGGFLGHKATRFTYLFELILSEKVGAKKTFDIIKERNDNKDNSKQSGGEINAKV